MDRFVQRSNLPARQPLTDVSNSKSSTLSRPSKRCKPEDGPSSDDEASIKSEDDSQAAQRSPPGFEHEDSVHIPDGRATPAPDSHKTAMESSMAPVQTDQHAIEEYEVMRASQVEVDNGTAASRIDSRKWVRGKSSIYVDAFNLALDTVLEDEAHLFDDKEKAVFQAWQSLSYEAQYLSVVQ